MPEFRGFKTLVGNAINRLSDAGYIKAPAPPAVVISPAGGVSLPIDEEYFAVSDKLEQYEKLALTCAWVYSDINVLGKETSKAAFTVQEVSGEDKTPVVDHEFERLMRRPNPHMSGTYVKQYTVWWWMLRGEAYWLKIFNRAGELKQIYPLPSNRIKPIGHRKKYISGYRYSYKRGRRPIVFRPEQIVYFRFPHPFKYHRGLPPIVGYFTALMTDTKAARWNMTAYEKGMSLQTLIGLRPELSKPQYEKARDELIDQLINSQQRYLIARTGDVDATTLSLSPREAEYLASRNLSKEEIDRVFGFPEGYWEMSSWGDGGDSKAKAMLIDGVIWPLLLLMCEEITAQIIIPQYGENLICYPEDIRIQDKQLGLAVRESHSRSMSYDESRADIDLEPYDGPFADIIGPLPFQLAVNPSFILAVSQQQQEPESTPTNGGQTSSPLKEEPEADEEEMPEEGEGDEGEAEEQAKAIKGDLDKWRRVEINRAKAGDPPGYEFESEVIPPQLSTIIKAALMVVDAPDEDHVRATFKAALDSLGDGGAPDGDSFQSWQNYG